MDGGMGVWQGGRKPCGRRGEEGLGEGLTSCKNPGGLQGEKAQRGGRRELCGWGIEKVVVTPCALKLSPKYPTI